MTTTMKQLFRYLCIATLFCVVGCLPMPKEEVSQLVIKATSTDGAEWCEGDDISLIESGVRYRTLTCRGVDDDNRATFLLEDPLKAEKCGYGAVYPASALLTDDSIDLGRVRLRIPAEQTPTSEYFDSEGDVRVARYQEFDSLPSAIRLSFERVVATGTLRLENLPEGSFINELSIDFGKVVAGELGADLCTGEITYPEAGTQLTLRYATSVPADTPLYFVSAPFELKSGDEISLKIKCGDELLEHTETIKEDISFTLAEHGVLTITLDIEPELKPDVCTFKRVDKITSGKAYLIASERQIATYLHSNYGYLDVTDGDSDDDGIIELPNCENAFIFESTDGGYTIRQAMDDRYLYQYNNYDSFNVDAAPTEGHIWSVAKQSDGFKITNKSKSKYVQYSEQHTSFGSYSSTKGLLPELYELLGEIILPEGGDDIGNDDGGGSDDEDDSNEDDGDASTTLDIIPDIELPRGRTDGAYPEAVTITVTSGGDTNYTHFYDIETYTSMWVAYPLSKRHMGSYGRPDAWDWNPYINTSDQVNLCSRSYAGDYSRGHLIPNASRNGIREMQLQTFYVTNSVPQVQGGFNGGIWQKLEAALQDIAESETIYIVTGVAFNKTGENRTISYTKAKDDSKSIPVPNYFYKVVLKIKLDADSNIVDAQSVGFWFENKYHSNNTYSNYAVSVDQIEAWTGFDFFPAIKDELETVIESNSSWSTFTTF